ncbi:glycosyl hydrolase family 61-domain-containing protein [Ampelomyces quisqualis]|uniref:AA9 family lytic polysaccharide monooxygenase n=1 Tax=Ampelomyces quisqualis TaxID=50730 RepID=A0A6A5QSY1_AMPQU|nr:glycosyl hydrolase family 61-domain-containing protein [Ampelomyces quisqualis]
MRTSVAFAFAAAKLVAGHATFQSFVVDGADVTKGVQVPSNGNNPILDVASTAMNCNGGKATTDFVDFTAGSEITMQWHHNNPATLAGDADEPIAASHMGPVMVYMAKADTNGEGAVWTKIYEDGLTNGVWAVKKFIDNKGKITVTLPNLEDGEYLIRPEMIGLHEANREKGAQFYSGCGQIKVTGGSVALPASGTDMTKAYSASDPGVLYNMYGGLTTYEIPGPKVWDGASSGSAPAPSTPTKSAAPSAPATPSKTGAPVSSPSAAAPVSSPSAAAAASSPSAAAPATPSKTATPEAPEAPAPAPSSGAGNGSSLPETFTIAQFIAWLKQQSGTVARRHAREFALA